ncbi:MAG: mycofactocin precursor MftA [Pseudonocardia sp.]
MTRDDWEDPQMAPVEQSESSEEGIVEESLVEEVSIDGMCGVY